jgi:hypothetical protein
VTPAVAQPAPGDAARILRGLEMLLDLPSAPVVYAVVVAGAGGRLSVRSNAAPWAWKRLVLEAARVLDAPSHLSPGREAAMLSSYLDALAIERGAVPRCWEHCGEDPDGLPGHCPCRRCHGRRL